MALQLMQLLRTELPPRLPPLPLLLLREDLWLRLLLLLTWRPCHLPIISAGGWHGGSIALLLLLQTQRRLLHLLLISRAG